MKIGTRSVLFGVHQFAIHPWFVAWAWWRLYGFPWDPRLWFAFFLHDLGYWGKPNMDGPEGEKHPEFGARVMALFDRPNRGFGSATSISHRDGDAAVGTWSGFVLYHSRFVAKRDGMSFSRLCVADKLTIVLTPWWIYGPLACLTGEIREYMELSAARSTAGEPKYASMNIYSSDRRQWYMNVQEYLRRWVAEHKDGQPDMWTPTKRKLATSKRQEK